MRVSTFKDDPGYANGVRFRGCLVLLNWAEVRCFTADEEQGMVVVPRLSDGRIYVDRETGKVACETLFGAVHIIPPAVQPSACIAPNAEMLQKDAIGIINGGPSKKLREQARSLTEMSRQLMKALRDREPVNNLDVVAPMDHRLGRFNR